MEAANENNIIEEIRQTRSKKLAPKVRKSFRTNAKYMGIVAGLLMSTFLTFTGFYISGDHAGIGFAKYIILAATLGVLLSNVKRKTPGGATFKNGMSFGLVSSGIAAIVLAAMTIIINSFGETSTIKPYFQQAGGQALNTMVLAGITLVETFVAGMILTFIWLQFLKDDSTVSESVE